MIKNGTITSPGSGATAASEGRIAAIKAQVDEIRHRVNEVTDQAMTRGSALVDKATDYIKANPMKSAAIAFGAGYFGMRLFRR